MSVSQKETEQQLFIFYLPLTLLSLTHTKISFTSLSKKSCLLYEQWKESNRYESQPNFYQFNCLLHVLALGKATIKQLEIHEHSFNTAGCSVEGVG
jgi:hypothetical protein